MPGCRDDSRDRFLDLPPRRVLRVGGGRPGERGAPPSTPGPPAVRRPTTVWLGGTGSSGSGCHGSGTSWRSSLVIVQPATVLAWHRQGFRLYWRWKSRPNPVGRPRLDAELRHLIRRMARENPTWGRRRIQAELALLGYEVAELTVAKYMHRTSPRPSPTWRAFLAAHARDIVAIDFFVVPTLTFRLLFVFVVLRHRPPRTPPSQRHGSSHGRLDRPPDRRGLPGRDRAEISAPRSGCHLRRVLHPVHGQHGDSRGAHRSREHPGRTRSPNGSSAPSAASASITSSF